MGVTCLASEAGESSAWRRLETSTIPLVIRPRSALLRRVPRESNHLRRGTRQARRSNEPRLNFRKSRFPCISNRFRYLGVSCNGNADDEKLDDSREENTVRAPLTTTALVEKTERSIHAQSISKSYIHSECGSAASVLRHSLARSRRRRRANA